MKKNHSKGFTIVEVLLSIGISSIVALATTYSIVSSMNGMSHVRNLGLAEDAVHLVSGLLSDANYCGLHFNGKAVPAIMDSEIEGNVIFKDMTSATTLGTTEILKAGIKYQNILQIDSIKLYVTSRIGANRFVGSLRISFKNTNGLLTYFERSTSVFITTNAASNIVNCSQVQSLSLTSVQYVRGQIYGHCRQDLDASFNVSGSTPPLWPMLTCPNNSPPTCDTGYTLSISSFIQMNTRDSIYVSGIPVDPDPRVDLRRVIGGVVNGDSYMAFYGCIKN